MADADPFDWTDFIYLLLFCCIFHLKLDLHAILTNIVQRFLRFICLVTLWDLVLWGILVGLM